MSRDTEKLSARLTGVPERLHPVDIDEVNFDTYSLIASGPRNLAACPFDYRNPFPSVGADADRKASSVLGPLGYFMAGYEAMGIPGGPECALIDAHGTLVTHSGAWAIGIDEPVTIVPQLTLVCPENTPAHILSASFEHKRCGYRLEYFATRAESLPKYIWPMVPDGSTQWLGGVYPESPNIFLCIHCEIWGYPEEKANSALCLSYAQSPGLSIGADQPEHGCFASSWDSLRFEALGDGRFQYIVEDEGQERLLACLFTNGSEVDNNSGTCTHWPPAPEGAPQRNTVHHLSMRQYATPTPSRLFLLVIPYLPPEKKTAGLVFDLAEDTLRAGCQTTWQMNTHETTIRLPESKTQGAFDRACKELLLQTRKVEHSLVPTPGPTGTKRTFSELHLAETVHALTLLGAQEHAACMLEHLCLRNPKPETAGMVLWAIGTYHSLVDDSALLQMSWSDIKRHVMCLIHTWRTSQSANKGLFGPIALEEGGVAGHSVAQHLYTSSGLQAAVNLADRMGEMTLADSWKAFRELFDASMLSELERLVQETDGVIYPTFDGASAVHPAGILGAYGQSGGNDGLNLAAVYPTEVLDPKHPWITSSLSRWGNLYVEGLFSCAEDGDFATLSPNLTLLLAETWLRRGNYAEAIRDLYGVLLHTTAAHTSPDKVDSRRRQGLSLMPDPLLSARLIRYIRNMLFHESGEKSIRLFAGLSPAWMQPGEMIRAAHAPTHHGLLTVEACFGEGNMEMHLDLDDKHSECSVTLCLPPFLQDVHVSTNAGYATKKEDGWHLPDTSCQVRARWRDIPLPDISFESVVTTYGKIRRNALRS